MRLLTLFPLWLALVASRWMAAWATDHKEQLALLRGATLDQNRSDESSSAFHNATPEFDLQAPQEVAIVTARAVAVHPGIAFVATGPFDAEVGIACGSQSDCGVLPGLACVNGKCEYCRRDLDCGDHPHDLSKRCHVMRTHPLQKTSMSWLFTTASTTTTTTTNEQLQGQPMVQMGRNSTGAMVQASYCIEKDLFGPFASTDFVATLIAFLSTALGAGCGVGGGGLLVPLYILVVGLSPKHAIPLSKATIFGTSIATLLVNLRRKHPLKRNVPIIFYAVAAIMEPATLIGAVFGVMMNHMFPNWLINLLLLSLLSYITYRTFLKGNKLREQESQRRLALVKSVLKGRPNGGGRGRRWSIYRHFDWQIAAHRWLTKTRRNRRQRQILQEDQNDFESLPPLQTYSQGLKSASDFGTFAFDDSELHSLALYKADRNLFPLKYVGPLVISWLVVFVQALVRGGHGSASVVGIKCNSAAYWIVTILPMGILVAITVAIGYNLRLENRLRVLSDFRFVQGDIHWTKRQVFKFPTLCTVAGVAAGLLGIGGGMVKGPIMLEMGILPPVQSATASFMILFTSSSTTLQFAIAGQFPGNLQYDYVGWFTFVGFVGGMMGQTVVSYLVKRYHRESIMVYLLAATIGLSALCMGIVGIKLVVHDIANGVHLGFSGVCQAN